MPARRNQIARCTEPETQNRSSRGAPVEGRGVSADYMRVPMNVPRDSGAGVPP